jgi:membrane fusion protein, multidrug efflux system
VFSVASLQPLLARVHVPAREFRQLQVDQHVQLVLDSSRDVLGGRIALISPVIDPASGTIKVTVEVPRYPAGTRPGDFAEVRIVTELRADAVLVPRIAVVTEKGESAVFVVQEGDEPRAERRLVEVGFTEDDRAQILAGVAAGERVVVKGQRSLQDGQLLKILEEA